MPSYKRPGVYVSEFVTANTSVSTPATTQAAFVGPHWKGPTTATLVRSWTEFVRYYGGFAPTYVTNLANPYLAYAVYNYFNNGGREAWIVRVNGTGVVTATKTLQDRAGTPQNTLRVDALNPGQWGNQLRVDIVDRDATNGRFDLIVKDGGTTDAYVVERWVDLSMNVNDSRYAPSVINSTVSGSAYIFVVNLSSASVAPNNTPAVSSGQALAAGSDGSAPTSGQIQGAITAGTSPLDVVDGVLTINLPGESTSAVINTAVSFCEARGNSFLIVDPASGRSSAQVLTDALSFTKSGYAALYYPWVTMIDPAVNTPTATRNVPPGGFIAGKVVETDTNRGVWKAPAGLSTRLANTIGLELKLSDTDLDSLNNGNVNAIRNIPGAGVVVMGARTLQTTRNDRYVPVRRTLNFLKQAILDGTQWAIFEPNDINLWSALKTSLDQFLTGFWRAGGLRGVTVDEAFYVKCDDELNTPAVIEQGEVRIEIGVSLQYPAEFVVVRIGQWEGGNAAVEV